MKLFLDSLEVENFKGIQHATFQFGNETSISGANALGKTSIVDAYCWLLTNRDSRGNTPGSDKFREKPLDEFGQERHGLDTTVEARFLLDGQPLVLKRTQRENWVKKRGNAEATYQGNASTYWINSVETKSTDFQERINQIANGDVFNLITTLGAFNALDWKKRRAILIGMSGVDVDAELLKRDEFSSIRGELERLNIGVDDLKKVLADRKRDMAKELTLIPARIDEARHMRPQVS
jgi:predicted ATP-dependent endonuclease of OLD family